MTRDHAHVLDAVQAARLITQFMDGIPEGRFLDDIEKQSAVLHQFTILGEALRRVSGPFRAAHTDVDWAGAIAFRSVIVHDYDDVDLDMVWRIVHDDMPRLVTALSLLVPDEAHGSTEDSEAGR